ncbi:metallophosphoesterase [Anaeromicrobium sediminis]|uniref:Serine/threonine protein phosphatase n=1 Tax=Anaeromicrobium sediminis TaxID=1478221 RepID=A0A267MM13_9FIRM|nr:metallophosphoesterase [Anaeromicrobium sediminis]PAB60644.1 serine/threonine protein phosphatase [Anaeromicrobium sediminis]
MSLYAIGDLHLSFSTEKPMDIFGKNWIDHHIKIEESWRSKITNEDTVLIPGDISWAMSLEDAKIDLEWIDKLPGKKILLRGNHDYWWTSLKKMNGLFESMVFVQNNHVEYEDYAICGTRGWLCPNDNKFTDHDQKIYDRELHRLKLSLDSTKRDKIIVMTHYPPTNDKLQDSGFTKIYEEYNVEKVIYGHLHGRHSYNTGLKGNYNNVEYVLTSCDYLDFNPVKIL